MGAEAKVIEIPQMLKTLPCGKCGREVSVGVRVVLAYCRSCSQNLGVKQ